MESPSRQRVRDRHQRAQVLWLGGMLCAGKTSVAKHLIARYRPHYYHYDAHEQVHVARSHPERQPFLYQYSTMSMDQR